MKNKNHFLDIFLRYFLLLIVALPNLNLFYFVFTPLTIYPIYFLFKLFFSTILTGNTFFLEGISVEIIEACVAGAAYYLLLILNISIPNVEIKKRFKMIGFAYSVFLLSNLIRIFVFAVLFLHNYSWFNFAHKLFWYFGSIIFVVAIWFTEVKVFKIKEIPFYSDIKFLIKKIF